MKKVTQVLAVVILVLIGSSSYAQKGQGRSGQKPSPENLIKTLDKDKDDKISRDEASNASNNKLLLNFDSIDANKDEYLDLAELKKEFEEGRRRN